MDEEFNKDMTAHMEKMTMQKLKQELISTKQELEHASKNVTELNQEINAQ